MLDINSWLIIFANRVPRWRPLGTRLQFLPMSLREMARADSESSRGHLKPLEELVFCKKLARHLDLIGRNIPNEDCWLLSNMKTVMTAYSRTIFRFDNKNIKLTYQKYSIDIDLCKRTPTGFSGGKRRIIPAQ